jgi:hypothetical protein
MKLSVLAVVLSAAVCLPALDARAAGSPDCPIELVVGRIRQINGDPEAVSLHRDGGTVPAQAGTCLLYGDRLEVGLRAVAVVETARETRHVGGHWDPSWDAPAAVAAVPDSASGLLARLFQAVMSPAQFQTSYMSSRGSQGCPRPRGPMPAVAPLARLRSPEQRIGSDLRVIVAAWAQTAEPQPVEVQLLAADGRVLGRDRACVATHLVLRLPPGLQAGDRLVLSLADESGGGLQYRIAVVDPGELPQPPTALPMDWLVGAWRLAAAGPESQLDGLARVLAAPESAYGAQRVLDAVWADRPF